MVKRAEKIDVPAARRRAAQKTHFFDMQPITLGGFRLTGRAAVPVGRPSLQQWVGALDFSAAVEDAGPFWVGDLWNYRKTRRDWSDNDVVQALGSIGRDLSVKALENRGWISAAVTGRAKQIAPTIGHADAVAVLDAPEQIAVLEHAVTEGWTVHETRRRVRSQIRTRLIEGQAVLSGLYRVIYADPPWEYRSSTPTRDGSLAKARDHYDTMSIDEICKLPVAAHALPNSVLFLWVTAPLLLQNPGPREVLEAWGFEYKTNSVWDKVLGNFGHYFHVSHEHLIVCTRGSCQPDAPVPQPDSVQTIRRSHVHSEKPEEYRRLITQLYTAGPYLELFGRRPVDGWSVFGNDPRLWVEDAEHGGPVRSAADAVRHDPESDGAAIH